MAPKAKNVCSLALYRKGLLTSRAVDKLDELLLAYHYILNVRHNAI